MAKSLPHRPNSTISIITTKQILVKYLRYQYKDFQLFQMFVSLSKTRCFGCSHISLGFAGLKFLPPSRPIPQILDAMQPIAYGGGPFRRQPEIAEWSVLTLFLKRNDMKPVIAGIG